jgi:hypothetical protein
MSLTGAAAILGGAVLCLAGLRSAARAADVELTGVLEGGLAPDGERVLRCTEDRRGLELYDLPSRKALWREPCPALQAPYGPRAFFSVNGRFFILYEGTETHAYFFRCTVRRSDTGAPVSPLFHDISNNRADHPTADAAAVSDDGRWMVCGAGPRQNGLTVFDVGTGERRYNDLSSRYAGGGVFSPDGRRLAVTVEVPRMVGTIEIRDRFLEVLALEDGQWRSVARFEKVLAHAWVPGGLALVTSRGVEVWSGSARELVFPMPGEMKQVFFRGPWLAAVDRASGLLEVYGLKDRRKVFPLTDRDWTPSGDLAVWDVDARGDRLVLAVSKKGWPTHRAVLLEFDLKTGRRVKKEDMGALKTWSMGLPVYGSPRSHYGLNFSIGLTPGGKYLHKRHMSGGEFTGIYSGIDAFHHLND